jgi:hypothetical protein
MRPSVAVTSTRRLLALVLALPLLIAATGPGASSPLRFNDVHDGSIFASDIEWMVERSITLGCDNAGRKFCPGGVVTRGQMAAFVARAAGLSDQSGVRFVDVPPDSPFLANIDQLATAGVTRGCGSLGDRFCPDEPVTRAQMAAFLARAAGLSDTSGSRFDDVPGGSEFSSDIDQVATAGITRGCDRGGRLFCPKDAITRGQLAAMLRRAHPPEWPIFNDGRSSYREDPSSEPTPTPPSADPSPTPPEAGELPGSGVDGRWSLSPDAVVSSWSGAEKAYDEGARVIHLESGSYAGHTWKDRPGVFVRNVPGESVALDKVTVVARDVTFAGVTVDWFEVRNGGDGTMLYRSHLVRGSNVNGGHEDTLLTVREVHRPDRREVSGGDVFHVNAGGSLRIEDSYIEGDDLVPGADGHTDTVQIVNGGRDLIVKGSFLGRSHNAVIIEGGGRSIRIEDSFLDWRVHNELRGGLTMGWQVLDTTVINSTTPRLRILQDRAEVDVVAHMTIEGNTFAGSRTDPSVGRISFEGWGNWGDDLFPNNRILPSDELPTPDWERPTWWDEIAGT